MLELIHMTGQTVAYIHVLLMSRQNIRATIRRARVIRKFDIHEKLSGRAERPVANVILPSLTKCKTKLNFILSAERNRICCGVVRTICSAGECLSSRRCRLCGSLMATVQEVCFYAIERLLLYYYKTFLLLSDVSSIFRGQPRTYHL